MNVSFRLRSSKSLSHFKSGHTYRAANRRAFNHVERFHRRHAAEIEDPVVHLEAAQTEQTEGLLDDSRAGCSLHNPDPALPQDYTHPVDMAEFRKLGYEVVDWISDYFTQQLSTLPVKPNGIQPGYLPPLLEKEAPEEPQPWSQVFQDFKLKLLPGAVHWQHPLFFAYFPANTSAPAMLADMLSGAINMIGFSWAAGPVSTELEMVMMDWLGKLCAMPEKFLHSSASGGGGVIQGTASEASIVSILAAKAKIMKGRPEADKLRLVAYSSNQAHSAFKKACMIADIDHIREIPATSAHHFALQPEALERVMQEDVNNGLLPFFVSVTIGTTSSCAVDPVKELAQVAGRYGAWIHVDAAYAGSAAICPELHQQYFSGLELVDSYSFNPHKWLLTNFDCSALWVADSAPLKEALSLTPVFLRGAGNAMDFKDWQMPLGRRFRALKLYFLLRMYGAESLRRYIRHHVALAQYVADRVAEDPRFEIAAPTRFGLVCFRLRGSSNEMNMKLLNTINASGDLFLIHTELEGKVTIRMAIGSSGTQLVHVQQGWLRIQEAATKVLA